MSTTNPTTSSSNANFVKIFEAATNEYRTITGQDLSTHPFSVALDAFKTPEAIVDVFRKQAQVFEKVSKDNEKLMTCLSPIVEILFTLTITIGEISNVSPAKAIFAGVGVLLGAVRDVIASYEMLVYLFGRIDFFLKRLKSYTSVRLTPEMIELLAKIMAQVLSVLALSTKVMKQKRIKQIMKRLVGRKDVEDALQRLDALTNEEALMTAARTLEVVDQVDANVTEVKEVIHRVEDKVEANLESGQRVEKHVVETKEVAYEISDNVADVRRDVRSMNITIKENKRTTDELHRNQAREKLRIWLSPPDPSVNHGIACKAHYDGTAGWFMRGRAFEEWKKNGPLLWVHGNPGSGKTVLCSTIIEDIKKLGASSSALVVYYYFDFRDRNKRDVRGLLASVLVQLANDSEKCWTILSQFHTECKYGSEQPSEAALEQCLKRMLELPGQDPIYITVDALDECPNHICTPSAREIVLEFLENLVRANHTNLFICVTSRPEQDIKSILNPLTSQERRVSLHDEKGQKEDISRYVQNFVHTDTKMKRWREEDKKLVIETLSERAGGMFRWVYCQLDTLRRCLPSSIAKALQDLPSTLDNTYEKSLEGIPKERRQHAYRLFQCLVAAIRPLSVEELAEVLIIKFDPDAPPSLMESWRTDNPEEELLSACSTLISIVEVDGSKIVQFSHFSVKEFLTADRLGTSETEDIRHYHIATNTAHGILARACLTVLLQLDEKVNKKQLPSYPLVFYAAQYWVDHARYDGVEPQIKDVMTRLFDPKQPHLGAWIWIHDVDSDIKRPPDSIDERPSRVDATPLYYASLCGLSWMAKHLITTRQDDVNAKCGRHGTPLHAAAHKGQVSAARVLLDYRASVNVTNRYRKSPLSMAYDAKHDDVIGLLLERGANVEGLFDYRGRLLHRASADGRTEVVRMVLRRKADVNVKGDMQWTPLHFASSHGHLEVVKLLVERKANVNALVRDHGTPMHLAARRGHIEIVRVLLQNEADVHIRGDDGRTALETANASGHSDIAQLLLDNGAKG